MEDVFGDGVIIGFAVGIGLAIWWWTMMRYANMAQFKKYYLQLDPETKNQVGAMFKEIREKSKIMANKTNSLFFKKWYNTLIDINSMISKKL
jgi:hypothetical protein